MLSSPKSMPTRVDLDGLRVLVTRPPHQAGHLCDLIAASGGHPVRFPLLAIRDLSANPAVQARLSRLAEYHLAIFISPNAVRFGLAAINRHLGLPSTIKLATVGRGSALALEQALGRAPDIVPTEHYDSEGLLALPALQQVSGQRVLVIRGEGGRELLTDTLRQRGATVDHLEVYRRKCPVPDVSVTEWLDKTDIITITSSEALQNLMALTPAAQRTQLLTKPLVVVSERTAALAQALGFHHPVIITKHAADEAILQALIDWTHRKLTEA